MIDFFEIDVDNIDKSRYKTFVVKSVNQKLIEEVEKNDCEFKKVVNEKVSSKKRLNSIFYYLSMILSIASLILALLVIQNSDAINKKFPLGFFIALLVCLALDIVFGIAQGKVKKQIQKIMKTDEIQKFGNKNRKLERKMLDELNVPQNVEKFDFFVRNVRIKNNELINALRVSYNNYSLYCYQDEGYIYFCDTYELIRFDKNEIEKIDLIKDKIDFLTWTKSIPCNDKIYKPFGVKYNLKGYYTVNCFYEVKLIHMNKEYVLRIPGYEQDLMKNIFNYEKTLEEENNENSKSGN